MTLELNSAVLENPAEANPAPEYAAVVQQCEQICGTEDFRNAASMQRLLRFLVMETLEGRAGALKEYSIGVEVFQRRQDFDPRMDAIVRVTVGQLRRRLATYYNGPGLLDPIVIQIPKGHYAATFTPAQKQVTESPATSSTAEGNGSPQSVSIWSRKLSWWIAGSIIVTLLFLSVGAWWLKRDGAAGSAVGGTPNLKQSLLWSTFLRGDRQAIAVVGIASSTSIGPVIVRIPQLNDERTMQNNPIIQKLAKDLGQPAFSYDVYTGIGEALAVASLEKAFTSSSLDLSTMASRDVRWQDLHTQNVIFVSSLHFRDLRSSLGRTSDFSEEETSSNGLQIVNHSPHPGESAIYAPSKADQKAIDYALISIFPGTTPDHHIMAIGGTDTLGTGAAAQFVTERQSLLDLDAKLKRDMPAKGGNAVQILLRIEIVDNEVVAVHYVTHHWIPS
jgi:hypothetical protein